MAIRRRRPASKAAQAPTSRVHAVSTLEQWEGMLAKAAAARRLVCVQFFQANNYACSQMRGYYRRMSVDPALKAAVFAEVEVDTAEDELLEGCGLRSGAKLPCYQCFVAGLHVESYVGGVPAEVAKMLSRQLAELKGSGGGLLARLLLAAAGAAAAAAAAYWHLGRQRGGDSSGGDEGDGSAGDLGSQMRGLSERISTSQQRLRNAERAGRLKAAKNQRRILQQLQAQQRALEQQLRQRDQPGGDEAGGGAAAGQPRAGRRKRRAAAAVPPGWYSSDDEAPVRRPPTVLYSDEEE